MESIQRKQFNRYIEQFEFDQLFNQLGWNYVDQTFPKKAADQTFQFKLIAEKAGFTILICQPDKEGKIPVSQTRKRIHAEIAKLHHEHLIIFIDKKETIQQWELLAREPNKPVKTVSHKWIVGQAPELLYQKLSGAFFSIEEDEQGSLTIIDVVERIKENFGANAEKVTKKFYTDFKKQHSQFLDFIKGVNDHISNKENENKQWYASLMLNRLMFCYFIQKKGFLDQDNHYLKNKLKACQDLSGTDKFYSFYRTFLLELFHDGLGKPINKRRGELPVELGRIPYLNGGLFDVHELEHQFDKIQIDDNAFEKIFQFFDNWEWHLDTREHAKGKTINPDVIGYIFEKYINDRAAMGAYYTKEDITDYIGKNTIIPFLFDETERNYKEAFKPDAELWQFLKDSGNTYIYDAVRHGISENDDLFADLPEDVQEGINHPLEDKVVLAATQPHLWEVRQAWNQKTPAEIGLPTEIYRELIERRKRYADIKAKIDDGDINHINDFITYNLNIRQFTQDFIETTSDPIFIRHFYKALNKVTILDPTCGSGAFLFAAMNILEPLYETCVKRMEEFTEEHPGKHKYFEETLLHIKSDDHPNLQYFIYKSIILNNLFGVDIMKEAVEIAKLRLFLKLVAVVDVDPSKNDFGLEPLPDIDFNIRAGNTLIGFATENELLQTIQKKEPLFAADKLEGFKEEFELVSKAFGYFQNSQLINDQGSDSFKKAKAQLISKLKELNHKLNVYLATNYGIDAERKPKEYEAWLHSHQPFHWFAEFYQIVAAKGGFDCIIGNPPYVEYSKTKKQYSLQNIECISSGNLYAFVIERSLLFQSTSGYNGMIIQMSAFCTPRMESFQNLWLGRAEISSIAFFDDRPGKLFDGLEHIRVVINILKKGDYSNFIKTTGYIKFYSEHRNDMFQNINYTNNDNSRLPYCVLKVSNSLEHNIIQKLWSKKKTISSHELPKGKNENFVYYGYGYGYFGKILNYKSHFWGENVSESTGDKYYYLSNEFDRDVFVGILNSNLFYWYYINSSDGHNFTKTVIGNFPFDYNQNEDYDHLIPAVNALMIDLKSKTNRKKANYKSTGQVEYDEYFPKKSKPFIDCIDVILAEHYGFTEAELDFIINYDIKYRMGKALFGEADEIEEDEED